MINLLLPQVCTVKRAVTDYSSGSPVSTWKDIAKDVPCLYVKRDYETYRADAAPVASKTTGTLFGDVDAPFKTNDSVVIAGVGTFTIGTDGGVQTNYLGERSHVEWAVKQVA